MTAVHLSVVNVMLMYELVSLSFLICVSVSDVCFYLHVLWTLIVCIDHDISCDTLDGLKSQLEEFRKQFADPDT